MSAPCDSTYRSFPVFMVWSQTQFDAARWEQAAQRLRDLPASIFGQAQRRIKRLAAVETGVIELLYPAQPHLIAAATEDAAWESALAGCDGSVAALVAGHLAADDEVELTAAEQLPISEAWIRQLHVILCAAQQTVRVNTVAGPQQQSLLLGTYKRHPNHFYYANGRIHAYCPVERVAEEMPRLCQELRSDPFVAAHPLLQASYAHFGLAAIHPFQDGNGRTARALASRYTYHALGLPLLVSVVDRPTYFNALEAADAGNPQPLVDFMLAKVEATVRLAAETADPPS